MRHCRGLRHGPTRQSGSGLEPAPEARTRVAVAAVGSQGIRPNAHLSPCPSFLDHDAMTCQSTPTSTRCHDLSVHPNINTTMLTSPSSVLMMGMVCVRATVAAPTILAVKVAGGTVPSAHQSRALWLCCDQDKNRCRYTYLV